MVQIPAVLGPDEIRRCREILAGAALIDGTATAGEQSARAKRNLQLAEDAPEAKALGEIVLQALARCPAFMSAALPLKVFPPLFNLYRQGMGFGDHIDNAVRFCSATGGRYRTDQSCTLFLSDPEDYDGGELVIQDGDPRGLKLAAGDLALYPATAVHRVEPITRGERWASFFWVQSFVADAGRRALLYDLDRAIASARSDLGDHHPAAISLTGTYHNLIRMWAQL